MRKLIDNQIASKEFDGQDVFNNYEALFDLLYEKALQHDVFFHYEGLENYEINLTGKTPNKKKGASDSRFSINSAAAKKNLWYNLFKGYLRRNFPDCPYEKLGEIMTRQNFKNCVQEKYEIEFDKINERVNAFKAEQKKWETNADMPLRIEKISLFNAAEHSDISTSKVSNELTNRAKALVCFYLGYQLPLPKSKEEEIKSLFFQEDFNYKDLKKHFSLIQNKNFRRLMPQKSTNKKYSAQSKRPSDGINTINNFLDAIHFLKEKKLKTEVDPTEDLEIILQKFKDKFPDHTNLI